MNPISSEEKSALAGLVNAIAESLSEPPVLGCDRLVVPRICAKLRIIGGKPCWDAEWRDENGKLQRTPGAYPSAAKARREARRLLEARHNKANEPTTGS